MLVLKIVENMTPLALPARIELVQMGRVLRFGLWCRLKEYAPLLQESFMKLHISLLLLVRPGGLKLRIPFLPIFLSDSIKDLADDPSRPSFHLP